MHVEVFLEARTIAVDSQSQRLGDRLAHTQVVEGAGARDLVKSFQDWLMSLGRGLGEGMAGDGVFREEWIVLPNQVIIYFETAANGFSRHGPASLWWHTMRSVCVYDLRIQVIRRECRRGRREDGRSISRPSRREVAWISSSQAKGRGVFSESGRPQEVEMTRFIVCTIVLALVPMSVLNPMGRSAFLGYYLGVITMWLMFVFAGQFGQAVRESRQ